MPPRYRKRKSNRFRSRSNKRRRTGGRRTFRRRSRSRTRRPQKLRRFRRKFRTTRRRRRSSQRGTPSREKLEWTLAPPKVFTREFGQVAFTANAVNSLESSYFTPEETDTEAKIEDDVLTRPLGNIYDLMLLANYAWPNNPSFVGIGTVPAQLKDWFQGSLWWKGTDRYTIRNMTSEPIFMKAYYMTPRQHHKEDTTMYTNLYRMLGRGFQERGYDTSNGSSQNAGMDLPTLTPYQSSIITRRFKITRVQPIRVGTGAMKVITLSTNWRSVQPISLVMNAGNTDLNWTQQQKRYDYIKGERIIIFKLFSNPAAITGQSTFTKNIGQSQTGIIMHTARRYTYKHLPIMGLENIVTGTPHGVVTGASVVMRDQDWIGGPTTIAE